MRHGVFGVLSAIAFLIALIMQVANVGKGHVFTVVTFALLGLLFLAVHETVYWYQGGRVVA